MSLQSFACLPSKILSRLPQVKKELLVYLMRVLSIDAWLMQKEDHDLHRNHLSSIDSSVSVIVKELEEKGVYISSLESLNLPRTTELILQSSLLRQELDNSSLGNSDGNQYAVVAPSTEFVKYCDIYRWGLNTFLLKVVENYLKSPVAYGFPSFRLHRSKFVSEQDGYWHFDREDKRMLKVAVYFNDVTEDGGPFEIFDRQSSSIILNILKKHYPFLGPYKPLSHRNLLKLIPTSLLDNLKSFTGLQGTVIFFDPVRLFHRGKPSTQVDRCGIFYSYYTRTPHYPFFCGPGHFSEKHRHYLAENLSDYQRECVFWRNELNPIQKYLLTV
ncbi:MAG: hypothetical protein F6K48_12235 [Okeania sp. SIO3H1]|nr:hypothetical protein [Okeania sp. SIO3H1]